MTCVLTRVFQKGMAVKLKPSDYFLDKKHLYFNPTAYNIDFNTILLQKFKIVQGFCLLKKT